jgi:hypothetical protein
MEATQHGTGQAEHLTMEWGIFRKGEPTATPAENLRYTTRAAAEKTRRKSYLHPEHYEVRGREIGPWDVKAREAVAARGL